jgi:two-component system OmpR family sensor kinase
MWIALPFGIGLAAAAALAGGLLPDWLISGRFHVTLSLICALIGGLLSASIAFAVWLAARIADRRQRAIQAAEHATRAALLDQEAQARRRFFQRLDHELKNPITILQLGLGNLSNTTNVAESAARLEAQTRRLGQLVTDLRRLVELNADQMEREAVDVRAVLDEAITWASAPDAARPIEMTIQKLPWGLPTIQGDRDLLALAFRNLIENALKYTDQGKQIEIRARNDGSSVIVEIADAGRGIPAADLPHITEELYRGDNARDVVGSGLGLPLVRRIVELHGGALDVESRINIGSVFTVRLPIRL